MSKTSPKAPKTAPKSGLRKPQTQTPVRFIQSSGGDIQLNSKVTNDPILTALSEHETEIARLHRVILDLRGQQVRWMQANIQEPESFQIEPASLDVTDTQKEQIANLTQALESAWAELEAKQGHLETAVSDTVMLKAAVEELKTQLSSEVNANETISSQLDIARQANVALQHDNEVVKKRLAVALDLISRRIH
jgi:regulator of replication initiation timing